MKTIKKHLLEYWTLYAYGVLVLSFLLSYWLNPDFQTFMNEFWSVLKSKDEAKISSWFIQFGIWGPLLIILLMVVQMFLIVFPSWLPMVVAVLGYGPWVGMIISIVAVFVASTIGYHLGERASEPVKKHLVGEKNFKKVSSFMERHGFWAVVLFRISPFLSNDGISFVAGTMKMGYRQYILATMVGIIPLAAAIAYFGKETDTLENGLYWIGGAGLLVYLIYLLVQQRDKSKDPGLGPKEYQKHTKNDG
ncbi:MAG TPA: TVP38/TMEM64 family protein [Saprospiraceae bacterium]|nr:TVP38/TMEM64 family protein [Saprospiraceae bacterium]